MDRYHLKKKNSQWKLYRQGADRASKVFYGTKEEAIRESAEFLKPRVASLKIHTEDGKLQEERTYPKSSDPIKRKG